jgi:hypothetical protein
MYVFIPPVDSGNLRGLPYSVVFFFRQRRHRPNNPVEAGFAAKPHYWKESSAANYSGKPGIIEIGVAELYFAQAPLSLPKKSKHQRFFKP